MNQLFLTVLFYLHQPSDMDIPIVSLDAYLSNPSSPAALAEAIKAAESLIVTGALVVRDSRAPTEANDRFIDLFEDYFALPDEVSKRDERPELGYQVVCFYSSAQSRMIC